MILILRICQSLEMLSPSREYQTEIDKIIATDMNSVSKWKHYCRVDLLRELYGERDTSEDSASEQDDGSQCEE